MRRLLVLWAALTFIGGFAVLTVIFTAKYGFELFSALSLFILVLLAVGVIGALRNPPR
jgi:hypothetical protein